MSTLKHNLTSVSKFAALKKVGRSHIQNLIDVGKIIPVILDGRTYIDLDVYADYKVNKKIGRPSTGVKKMIDDLTKEVKELKEAIQVK
jgi:hypothetical protein